MVELPNKNNLYPSIIILVVFNIAVWSVELLEYLKDDEHYLNINEEEM